MMNNEGLTRNKYAQDSTKQVQVGDFGAYWSFIKTCLLVWENFY